MPVAAIGVVQVGFTAQHSSAQLAAGSAGIATDCQRRSNQPCLAISFQALKLHRQSSRPPMQQCSSPPRFCPWLSVIHPIAFLQILQDQFMIRAMGAILCFLFFLFLSCFLWFELGFRVWDRLFQAAPLVFLRIPCLFLPFLSFFPLSLVFPLCSPSSFPSSSLSLSLRFSPPRPRLHRTFPSHEKTLKLYFSSMAAMMLPESYFTCNAAGSATPPSIVTT